MRYLLPIIGFSQRQSRKKYFSPVTFFIPQDLVGNHFAWRGSSRRWKVHRIGVVFVGCCPLLAI